jgi:uncharacterized OB-fold protein
MDKIIQTGWMCPNCGTVWGPHVNQCTNCHVHYWTSTDSEEIKLGGTWPDDD